MLGLADDASLPRPALAGAIDEISVHALGLARRLRKRARLGQLSAQSALQPGIASQAKDIAHTVLLTPSHQLLARKPRVPAQDDLHLRPTAADLVDQARDLVDGAGRSIDVGAPQPSAQQVITAEDIERQVASTRRSSRGRSGPLVVHAEDRRSRPGPRRSAAEPAHGPTEKPRPRTDPPPQDRSQSSDTCPG